MINPDHIMNFILKQCPYCNGDLKFYDNNKTYTYCFSCNYEWNINEINYWIEKYKENYSKYIAIYNINPDNQDF